MGSKYGIVGKIMYVLKKVQRRYFKRTSVYIFRRIFIQFYSHFFFPLSRNLKIQNYYRIFQVFLRNNVQYGILFEKKTVFSMKKIQHSQTVIIEKRYFFEYVRWHIQDMLKQFSLRRQLRLKTHMVFIKHSDQLF